MASTNWNLFAIVRSTKGVSLKHAGAAPGIAGPLSALLPAAIHGEKVLLGCQPGAAKISFLKVHQRNPWLSISGKAHVAKEAALFETFTLGNLPYLIAYAPESGILYIHAIAADFTLSRPLEFYRNHEPSITRGFTTLKAFTLGGQIVLLGYRGDTGYVAMYTVSVTATSERGVPPLAVTPVWAHQWAAGWTRFVFFQFGGSNFFFKTNTKKWNVNIDHVFDNPSAGTVEVASEMDPKRTLEKVDLVCPLVLAGGEPFYIAYAKASGSLGVSRFQSDCLGWSEMASTTLPRDATQICAITLDGARSFLVVA